MKKDGNIVVGKTPAEDGKPCELISQGEPIHPGDEVVKLSDETKDIILCELVQPSDEPINQGELGSKHGGGVCRHFYSEKLKKILDEA